MNNDKSQNANTGESSIVSTINSKRKHIKYMVFNSIMKYSLLLGLIVGIITIMLGGFQESFIPINFFLIMMGIIYTIFNIKSKEELFKEFISMIGVLVFIALLVTYINGAAGSVGINKEFAQMTFRTLQYLLSVCVSLFLAPLIVSSFKLVFLNNIKE